jgi:hypothetical protein
MVSHLTADLNRDAGFAESASLRNIASASLMPQEGARMRPDDEEGAPMIVRFLPLLLAGVLILAAPASAAERLRFWNLTTTTIAELYLAPAGTASWSANQCLNDRDGTVDSDERLTITGIEPGIYDVKLVDKKGRMCRLSGVKVEAGRPYAFSISDRDLSDCTK